MLQRPSPNRAPLSIFAPLFVLLLFILGPALKAGAQDGGAGRSEELPGVEQPESGQEGEKDTKSEKKSRKKSKKKGKADREKGAESQQSEKQVELPRRSKADIYGDADKRARLEFNFIEGLRAKVLGDLEGAMVYFQEVLRDDPQNDAALFELGKIYYEFNRLDDALSDAGRAAAIDPENEFYQLLYADVLNASGKHREAADVYSGLIARDPDNPEAYFQRAFSLQRGGEVTDAIEAYDMIEERFGLDEAVVLEKHKLYLVMGKIDQAADEVEKLIELRPDEAYFYGLLARLYESTGRSKDAEEVYERMLQLDSSNPELLLQTAEIHRQRGNYERFERNIRAAFASEDLPIDPKIAYLVPYIDSVGRKRFANRELIFDLNQVLTETHPKDPKSWAMFGDFLYYDGKLDEARAKYLQSLRLEQSIFDVWRQVFVIDIDSRSWDSLIARTGQAMELFPNQPLIYYFQGIGYSQQGEDEQAVRVFKQAVPMALSNPRLLADIYSNLGDAYHNLDKHTDSDKAYDKSLKILPDNAFVLNNYAYYLSERGENLELAEQMSRYSNELQPGTASFEDTYAWIRYKQGEYADALIWMEKALVSDGGSSAVLQDHYGDILFKLDRVDDAVQAWTRAKELGMDSAVVDRKIADRKLYE